MIGEAKTHAQRVQTKASKFTVTMDISLEEMKQWLGRVEHTADEISVLQLRALAATLDHDDPKLKRGDSSAPCWHWLYFLPLYRHSEIGSDGHPRRGNFLPPVPLPRRMWAAGRLVDMCRREGRSGPLVFVRVRHGTEDWMGLAVVKEQDIVYRDHPKSRETTVDHQTSP